MKFLSCLLNESCSDVITVPVFFSLPPKPPPPPQWFWHSSKMAARNAKHSISTILREDRELWTVYYAIPIRGNMKLITFPSWAYFFFTRSRLSIHINSQVACEQGLHSGESREVTREPHAKDDASFAARSPVFSRLVSLATRNGELGQGLIHETFLELPSLRVWNFTTLCDAELDCTCERSFCVFW